MPLTFSHPAIILPAKYLPGRWVSMTGLIIGSITPDFEYFIRMKEESIYSHTWGGMFWFDLPLSILLTFIYHLIIQNTFIRNSPGFLKKRLSKYMDFNWMDYFKHHFFTVIICLLMGIASHIFWDSFTHPDAYFVQTISLLRENTFIFGTHIENARLLQAISTIVGGLIVFYAIMRMPATNYTNPGNPIYYWFIIIVTGIVFVEIKILSTTHHLSYDAIALSIASGFIVGSMVAPFLLPKNKLF